MNRMGYHLVSSRRSLGLVRKNAARRCCDVVRPEYLVKGLELRKHVHDCVLTRESGLDVGFEESDWHVDAAV